MLGTEPSSAQWYKVPPDGQVTFTLTEDWGVFKGPPPANSPMGDALVGISYSDGTMQSIAFQFSEEEIYMTLEHTGYITGAGTITWNQVASLPPGAEFQIVSATATGAYDPTKPFEGGQEGAFVLGRVTRFATDASPTNPVVTNPTGPVAPRISVGGGSPSRIHAVIISGLSDPTEIIASPNIQLTGGIVALGKNASSSVASSAWSPGLEIIPDYALLTGKKIPPVTPNIIDVRIVRQDVTADFPSPTTQGH